MPREEESATVAPRLAGKLLSRRDAREQIVPTCNHPTHKSWPPPRPNRRKRVLCWAAAILIASEEWNQPSATGCNVNPSPLPCCKVHALMDPAWRTEGTTTALATTAGGPYPVPSVSPILEPREDEAPVVSGKRRCSCLVKVAIVSPARSMLGKFSGGSLPSLLERQGQQGRTTAGKLGSKRHSQGLKG